jgi:hypothetical protein
MAIYHAHIKSFSRGKGESSVAAAAYRAGIDLTDTSKRINHRYSQRKGVRAFHMLAPKGAPAWCSDPKVFWDANEAWESRANARVARELEVSLPNELDDAQREQLALALAQELVDRFQVVVLAAIHEPSAQGDQRNFHVHLLMSARQVGPGGLGERAAGEFDARQGKGAEAVREVRAWVGQIINDHLERAGHEIRVDHRSLKAQAAEAEAAGDLDRARELSRAPTRHVGKVATATERKAASSAPRISIFGANEEDAFEAALAQASREGRLAQTPGGHSHAQALAERGGPRPPEQNTSEHGVSDGRVMTRSMIRRQSWPRESGASPIALRLSKAARLGRVQGRDAEVLNAQAEITEGWIETQREVAQAAIDAMKMIPGIQFEPEFTAATEALLVRRVDVYGHKPNFFEDTEALTRAVRDYAVAMRDPHDARVALDRARARFSMAERETGRFQAARLRSAQRVLTRARKGVSIVARAHQDKQIREARRAMVDAALHVEKAFYMTRIEVFPTEEEVSDSSGGERQCDSNRRELRPSSTMRPH